MIEADTRIELTGMRALLFEEAGDDGVAKGIISDIQGTELDYWKMQTLSETTSKGYADNNWIRLELSEHVIFFRPKVAWRTQEYEDIDV